MFAILAAIAIMFGLSLARVPVVFALVIGAVSGGLLAGLGLQGTLDAFNNGLGGGAKIALAYGILGAFALALARSGLPDLLAYKLIRTLTGSSNTKVQNRVKYLIYFTVALAAVFSQNLIPVHIAFIPVLIPPLLSVFNHLNLDRRAVACLLTFGLVATYMFVPFGFGAIFLNDILAHNINTFGAPYGFAIQNEDIPSAMFIPVFGMFIGLLIALFVSYRKPRHYQDVQVERTQSISSELNANTAAPTLQAPQIAKFTLWMAVFAIIATLAVQLYSDSMILAGLVGVAILSCAGIFKWKEADDVIITGMRMMALIGFIMIAAQGFASVIEATNQVPALVEASVEWIGNSKALAAFLMLLIGLLITLGIGSSFSTVPILAIIYVPLCLQFGFSPAATIAIIGTAAALGDAGSPASDSTLGPTSGLNMDGQHDHMKDSVVPTFIHFNIPLIIFGWIAAMVL
ncbi:Na+/H+ antiporter family protein [Acinetobacter towneri]|uniref:Sodium:proton antiporter n=1 Tax=Acinetobacter towneri TaxID=202956 RepID=A0AB35M562_9GAMM|nr:Na+/H+ antiporter NhaC family protein [Acinetobacter towneri]MDM1719831.1 sodium:proton antiporter [Acinetobacter towneri]MDM1731911.1 sodium:proton antiporter [Acinetobacter towneri]MDM1734589.1 sodium:proton antiporter [Acinetobacter towneri]MDM1739906.1 sodium:proton antiporter [Acinetobacter towneri]MDM1742573.1 sodium:proton antiporter [Acinetobacter towneri]